MNTQKQTIKPKQNLSVDNYLDICAIAPEQDFTVMKT